MIAQEDGVRFGNNIKVQIYGGSHDEIIGVRIEGVEEGRHVDRAFIESFMTRRAPGRNPGSTARKEKDTPVFVSGIEDDRTTGNVIEAVIYNRDARPADYEDIRNIPRPSHADWPAWVKYGEIPSGGGPFSGRMTAALCVAGALCIRWLQEEGIRVRAHIQRIGAIHDESMDENSEIGAGFPTVSEEAADEMRTMIRDVSSRGDSIGGIIECKAFGMPVGVGKPGFGSLESMISQTVFAVPAVKGIEFGNGFEAAYLKGSENNDPFRVEDGVVVTTGNHHGGILGGLTSGMPIELRVAIKPTPSISMGQKSVDLVTMENTEIRVKGRHDSCIVPRAVPCIEAAVAIALFDALKE